MFGSWVFYFVDGWRYACDVIYKYDIVYSIVDRGDFVIWCEERGVGGTVARIFSRYGSGQEDDKEGFIDIVGGWLG